MARMAKSATTAWAQGRIDRIKVEATTEEDIERFMRQEGDDPGDPMIGYTLLDSPKAVVDGSGSPRWSRDNLMRDRKIGKPNTTAPKKLG